MFVIQQLKNTIAKLTGFFQYSYARIRNYYPCRFVGEKRSKETNTAIIIFRELGKSQLIEMPIKELLTDPNLIAHFHPTEALQIGSIALEEFIFELPSHERKIKFNQTKEVMLNSIPNFNSKITFKNYCFKNNCFDLSILKNTYPCKLVGGKLNRINMNTIIIFTILGKRDGHEKPLRELIMNKDFIEKFHPIDAIKFGFISLGDRLFKFSEIEKIESLKKDL